MKIKNILIVGLLLFTVIAYSQSDSLSRFPTSKRFMVEINFNPLSSEGIFSFDNLQTKYWINNKTALRLGIQTNYKNNSTSEDNSEVGLINSRTVNEESFLIGVKPGIEFRIFEKSKISPYLGFEFTYANRSSSSEYVDYSKISYDTYEKVVTNIEGSWRELEYYQYNGYYTYANAIYEKERAYQSYGANILLGADYNFIKNMYLGFEIGLGYEMINYKKIELDVTNYSPVFERNNITYASKKTADFGFYYNNSIRLGIYF